jgi:hypothetical protein
MEPTMISIRILSTAAAMALVVAMAVPTVSSAQAPVGRGTPRGGVHIGGGGGGAPVGHFGGGGPHFGGGYGGGYRHGGGGFIPGAVAGAIIGGAIATAPYGYYGGPGYYPAPGYYGDQYDDDGPVVVAPPPGGDDAVAYCMQTYRSYDPRSGTYLGYDGYRHPCP